MSGTPLDDTNNFEFDIEGNRLQVPSMKNSRKDEEKDEENEANPYRIPTDEEVFLTKDEEKRLKRQERERLASLPIHAKKTFTTRLPVKRYQDTTSAESKASDPARLPTIRSNVTAPASTGMYKENISDLLAKKRKMFLIQMSLDTKKFEIAKLDENTIARERKIEMEERALMRDVQRFDDFLTENDIRAVEAINMANEENRLKEVKKKDVQKLLSKIAAINNEISKLDDQLDNCKRYERFLDKLTPKEWKEQQEDLKRKQKQEEEEEEEEEEVNEREVNDTQIQTKTMDHKITQSGRRRKVSNATRSSRSNSVATTKRSNYEQNAQRKHQQLQQTSPAPSSTADEGDVLSSEENWKKERERIENMLQNVPEMYFKKPEDLLNIFSELEEENLFLIQNSQDIEAQLEDLKKLYRDTKTKRESEAEGLKKQIHSLTQEIDREERKMESIQSQSNYSAGVSNDQLLQQLGDEIKKVYTEVGFGTSSTQLKPLQMLTEIESKFETLLNFVNTLDPKWVMQVEKEQERLRRKKKFELRNEQLNKQDRSRKERISKEVTTVHKRQGKPLMFRSMPIQNRKKSGKATKRTTKNSGDQQSTSQFNEATELFA